MLSVHTFTVNPLQENTYVLYDESSQCVIIDCGALLPSECEEIVDFINHRHLTPIRHILTHYHPDHFIGSDTIYKEFGLSPEAHVDDQPLEDQRDYLCEYIFGQPLGKHFPYISQYFTSQEVITFGSHSLSIIHTPGHSPGSVTLYEPTEHVAFTGDTLFRESIGRTDFLGGSMFHIIQSLRILCQLPDDVRILPGHGPSTTIAHECAFNPYVDR